jgi:hypothetical protein
MKDDEMRKACGMYWGGGRTAQNTYRILVGKYEGKRAILNVDKRIILKKIFKKCEDVDWVNLKTCGGLL